ncbi:MAG: hypothetical protein KAH91_00025 [Thermoplasmatales archaeon]|nr:hypothetical protein [Thermoplasmatales archaeon]
MKALFKLIAILIVTILVLSSVYVVFYAESEPTDEETLPDDEDEEEDEDEGDDNETIPPQTDFSHTVFVEEAAFTTCEYCPNAAKILYDLYKSGEYNFYYITLIRDKSEKAESRINDELNTVGFPTVYYDGGYEIVGGGSEDPAPHTKALRKALSRDAPEIRVNVTAEYNENKSELTTTVLLESNESTEYTGHLKVHLTEIKSRWKNAYDDGTKPDHFAFLDYVINKNISIDAKGNATYTDKRGIDEFDIKDLNPEELMIIAVVFSSKSVKADSFPDFEDMGDFDAYYADAADGTIVVPGGNLPPNVGIELPETGKIHILGIPIIKTLFKRTTLIGKTTVIANAEDDSGIEKVEFYIDGKLKDTDEEAPYEYSFRKVKLLKRFVRIHTIEVIAYDDEGKTDTASIKAICFFL